jgi:hypothetical protein
MFALGQDGFTRQVGGALADWLGDWRFLVVLIRLTPAVG